MNPDDPLTSFFSSPERGAALIVNGSAEMFFVTAGGKSTFRGRHEMINNPYTIGYPGTCPNVICVGGSNRRNMITNINGEKASSSRSLLPENDVISWSSAGPTLDGRQKPDVLAPGYNIISAMSSCMTRASVIKNVVKIGSSLIESWREDGRPVNMIADSGTSMSTPVVTGVIALWLQADPTLTPAKIKEVLAATSKHINEKVTYPNNTYGHGEINAYGGLLNILKINTAIPDLPRQLVQVTLEGRTLRIEGCDNAPVTIYSLNGQQVFSAPATDGTIQLPVLSSGVYAVKVGHQGSTLIRL